MKMRNIIESSLYILCLGERKLEIVLPKATEGLKWTELFQPGDPVGEELLDPQLVDEVNKRLAHLTSERYVS